MLCCNEAIPPSGCIQCLLGYSSDARGYVFEVHSVMDSYGTRRVATVPGGLTQHSRCAVRSTRTSGNSLRLVEWLSGDVTGRRVVPFERPVVSDRASHLLLIAFRAHQIMKTAYPDGSLKELWYAVHVRSRFESQMSTVLRSKGYEEFLPTYRCRHRWSDRIKELDLPLFPGYLFSRFDARERLPILKSPGVIAIVGLGKMPIPISDEEIEAIQAIVRSGLRAEPWPHLTIGSRVFIEAGPLAGLEGIVVKVGKRFRFVVSVQLLQRSVGVEIERSWVRPVCEKPSAKRGAAGLADSGQGLCARAG